MLEITIPGGNELRLEHLLLDVNGTLTDRGQLIDGVATRLERLSESLELHLLTADTFGTAEAIASQLGGRFQRVRTGDEKQALMAQLGSGSCVAIGNGANDAAMLRDAALGIAVVGPEGLAASAAGAAHVLTLSINAALDLLLDPVALTATLRP